MPAFLESAIPHTLKKQEKEFNNNFGAQKSMGIVKLLRKLRFQTLLHQH